MTINNLIKKVTLLCLVELLFGAFIDYAVPADRNGFVFAVQDKEMLLLSSKPPRIIFVGGSNLAFGLNSELVEKEFNRPVINFGLHAALGLKTSLNIVERYVAKGDLVVIIPEYDYFERSLIVYGSNDILSDFLEIDPANVQYIAREKWVDLPLISLGIPERKINREIDFLLNGPADPSIYSRSSFNSYGDVVAHLGQTSVDPNKISTRAVLQANSVQSTTPFDILEEFHQKIINKGGMVFFDFPSLRMRNCRSTGWEKFNGLFVALKTRTTIPLLSTPQDRCYPNSYFYNTEYHLNAVGREIRTQQVIQSLSSRIK